MSTGGDEGKCPLCDGRMLTGWETKPHDIVGGICLECGFCYWTELGVASLKMVNQKREDLTEERKDEDETAGGGELKPLKELPIDLDALDEFRGEHGLEPLRHLLLTTPMMIKRIRKEVKGCKLGLGWSLVLLFFTPLNAAWHCFRIANERFKAVSK